MLMACTHTINHQLGCLAQELSGPPGSRGVANEAGVLAPLTLPQHRPAAGADTTGLRSRPAAVTSNQADVSPVLLPASKVLQGGRGDGGKRGGIRRLTSMMDSPVLRSSGEGEHSMDLHDVSMVWITTLSN